MSNIISSDLTTKVRPVLTGSCWKDQGAKGEADDLVVLADCGNGSCPDKAVHDSISVLFDLKENNKNMILQLIITYCELFERHLQYRYSETNF
jgi:hypothetical protein